VRLALLADHENIRPIYDLANLPYTALPIWAQAKGGCGARARRPPAAGTLGDFYLVDKRKGAVLRTKVKLVELGTELAQ
jgi:hypothetical protein